MSGDLTAPLFYDVLATARKVIVISAPYERHMTPTPDPFQNFRHNCLLHIIFGAKETKWGTFHVSTLFSFATGNRHFDCATHFDHIIYSLDTGSMNACFPREHKCSVRSLAQTQSLRENSLPGFLNAKISCNATTVEATFCLTCRRFMHPELLNRYSVSRSDLLECSTFLRPREPDITALVEPLSSGFCVVFLLTILILAKIISSLRIQGFFSCLAETALNMISAVPIQTHTQRFSHLLIFSCTLILGFFIGLIYANFVMSSFLDPR